MKLSTEVGYRGSESDPTISLPLFLASGTLPTGAAKDSQETVARNRMLGLIVCLGVSVPFWTGVALLVL